MYTWSSAFSSSLSSSWSATSSRSASSYPLANPPWNRISTRQEEIKRQKRKKMPLSFSDHDRMVMMMIGRSTINNVREQLLPQFATPSSHFKMPWELWCHHPHHLHSRFIMTIMEDGWPVMTNCSLWKPNFTLQLFRTVKVPMGQFGPNSGQIRKWK